MNIFIRFGLWWESRKKVSQVEFRKALEEISKSQVVPQIINKEFVLLKARLDRLELLTELKRESEPAHVFGAAKIS